MAAAKVKHLNNDIWKSKRENKAQNIASVELFKQEVK